MLLLLLPMCQHVRNRYSSYSQRERGTASQVARPPMTTKPTTSTRATKPIRNITRFKTRPTRAIRSTRIAVATVAPKTARPTMRITTASKI